MATEQTKQVNTPGGVQTIKAYVPDEGEIFYDTSEADGVLKRRVGENIETFDATNFLKQKYGLNDQQFAAKYPTWGSVLEAANTELKNQGFDTSKISKINMAVTGDVWKPTNWGKVSQSVWDLAGMSTQAGKQTGGDMTAFTSGEARPYTESEKASIASGVNGPVLATGEKVKPEDYAKYGITDTKAEASTYQVKDTTGKVTTMPVPEGEVKIATAGQTPQQGTPEYRTAAETRAPAGTRYLGPTEFQSTTKYITEEMNKAGIKDINIINSVIEDNYLQRQGQDIYLKNGAISIQEAIKKAQDLIKQMTTPTVDYGSTNKPATTSSTYNASDLLGNNDLTPTRIDTSGGDNLMGLGDYRNSLYGNLETAYDIPGLKEDIEEAQKSLSSVELAVQEMDKTINAYVANAKLNYEGIQNQAIPMGIITGQLAHQQRLDSITLEALQGQKQVLLSQLQINQGNVNAAKELYQNAMDKIDKSVGNAVEDRKWELTQLLKQQEKQDDRAWEIKKMAIQYDYNLARDEAEIIKSWAKKYPQAGDIIGTWRTQGFEAAANLVSEIENKVNLTSQDVAGLQNVFTQWWGTYGGQCGDFTHRISDGVPPLGNSFAEKMSKISTTDISKAKPGDVVVFRTNTPYGHAAVLLGYDPNSGTITTVESNWNGDEQISIKQRSWNEVLAKDGGIVYGTLKPEVAQMVSPYISNNYASYSYDVSEDITPTDRKKMTAIGLNPNNPDDVKKYVNEAYAKKEETSDDNLF